MTEEPSARLHARLEGRVQGVGFRYFVQRRAQELGLRGWVRNRWEGGVEVIAEGDRKALEALHVALSRGPSGAHVTDLQADWAQPQGEYAGFTIRQTA